MFQVSHILVLSQPDFVQKQVCSAFTGSEPAPTEELDVLRDPLRPARKLRPRGRLRW